MATPTASPQVSSTVGLKNVVIAPLTKDTETEHTYGALQLMAGAIEASITPENADPDVQHAELPGWNANYVMVRFQRHCCGFAWY